jgi:hypothetical protein
MEKEIERELARLEQLNDLELYQCLDLLETDPAPAHIKKLILKKINSIFNQRIGLTTAQ